MIRELRPFVPRAYPFSLNASARLVRGVFEARFQVTGLSAVALAAPASHPERKNELWKSTCFEAFLKPVAPALPGTDGEYLELNASPSGDWNAYRFTRYREGMREEPGITGLQVAFDRARGILELSADLRRTGLAGPLDVGLTAVLLEATGDANGPAESGATGRESFWALEHAGTRPDFHLARSFVLRLT